MPTIEEIKQRSLQMPKKKSANSKKILKVAIGIALAWLAYTYFVPKKLMNVPESYATSHFKELFATPYKKVVWFGADCPVSKHKRNVINMVMKQTGLDKHYEHRPFLQNSLSINPEDKLGHFIVQNCSGNICLLNPVSGKIVVTNEKNLILDMNKYIVDDNWQKIIPF